MIDYPNHCEERSKIPDGKERHCFHERVDQKDMVCCHCGELFLAEYEPNARHGQYKPKGPKQLLTALKRLLGAKGEEKQAAVKHAKRLLGD